MGVDTTMPVAFIEKDLSQLNTMALPCVAKRFTQLVNDDQVAEFFADQAGEVLILGGGSNVILPSIIRQPVVQLAYTHISTMDLDDHTTLVSVGAAVIWDDLVSWAVEQDLYGLENLSLIPGSVGAAPVQNIGAYGVELEDSVDRIRAFDRLKDRFVELSKSECEFSYRDSIFKREAGRFVITEVRLRLSRIARFVLEYGELASLMQLPDLSVSDVRRKVIAIRSAKLPNPVEIPNTGSFFKNPVVEQDKFAALQAQFHDIVAYEQEGGAVKLAAGWLIDRAGLKGYELDCARIHDKQALVITNTGNADQAAILALAAKVRDTVFEQYGVVLEQEPVLVKDEIPDL